jgi:hypothetical protein
MAIPTRSDLDAPGPRAAARASKDSGQARHLLALAAVYDGATPPSLPGQVLIMGCLGSSRSTWVSARCAPRGHVEHRVKAGEQACHRRLLVGIEHFGIERVDNHRHVGLEQQQAPVG